MDPEDNFRPVPGDDDLRRTMYELLFDDIEIKLKEQFGDSAGVLTRCSWSGPNQTLTLRFLEQLPPDQAAAAIALTEALLTAADIQGTTVAIDIETEEVFRPKT